MRYLYMSDRFITVVSDIIGYRVKLNGLTQQPTTQQVARKEEETRCTPSTSTNNSTENPTTNAT